MQSNAKGTYFYTASPNTAPKCESIYSLVFLLLSYRWNCHSVVLITYSTLHNIKLKVVGFEMSPVCLKEKSMYSPIKY